MVWSQPHRIRPIVLGYSGRAKTEPQKLSNLEKKSYEPFELYAAMALE